MINADRSCAVRLGALVGTSLGLFAGVGVANAQSEPTVRTAEVSEELVQEHGG